MENLPSSPGGKNGSKDYVTGDDALLLAAAALVPVYEGRLDVAHNAASNLRARIDAERSLIAYARYKIRTEHIMMKPGKGMCFVVGDKNPTRAEPEFLKRLKFVQGDAEEFTVWNTVDVLGVRVSIYRGV